MENTNNNIASNVAQAIATALDWTSSPDARRVAVSYLEAIKGGDVRTLATTSFLLVKNDCPSEIRLQAFKMLQVMYSAAAAAAAAAMQQHSHLVRLRWDELSPDERRNFANVAVDLMSEMANPSEQWALKSQTAALVAEIVRREGINLWQELFPSLVSLSSKGPVQAELVSMTLRWLPEDITVHNEDLEGDRRRLLLRGLTQSLPEIFPLLYHLLETHFGAAVNNAGQQQLDVAKQHAATVTATLNAINAYAEWAPLPDLAKHGMIHGCGYLLSSPDFRLHACEFFKLVTSRRRPFDASASEIDSAMSSVSQILMNFSRDFLARSGSIDEAEIEFAEYICESMVSLGTSNLQCISGDNMTLSMYLQQMLGFLQHQKLALHYQALLFWLALMRDLLSKPKAVIHSIGDAPNVSNMGSGSGQADNEKRKILTLLNDDICSVILDISFQRMLKKEKVQPSTAVSLGAMELWSDNVEGKGDFGQYRSKLSELIKFVASFKPLIAGSKISERIISSIKSLLVSSTPVQDLAVMESLQLALDNVASTIFDGSNEYAGGTSEVHLALCKIFEDLLRQLLSLKWTEPTLVEVLGHYFEALGPFLKYYPDAVGSVINKLFELLTSLPFVVKDPATSTARHARLQICASFIRIAKTADKSILPHMKGIADTMAYLQREGSLLRSEHNLLGEAFLVMACSAGIQQQQEVLAWLLEPLSQQWIQLEWQNNYLSEPEGLVRLSSDASIMWPIFHNVTFFEKALKRSGGSRKSNLNMPNIFQASSTLSHPIASHLSWMLPPLLKLLRGLHSLWSPAVYQSLPTGMKAAMTMSDVEQFSLLGEGNLKFSKGTLTFTDADMRKEGTEPNEADKRNWLKGIRDSGYNVLGLSTTIGDPFFKSIDSNTVAIALTENIQSMEFRHIKQLIHLVLIPLIKSCPQDTWDLWLEKLLLPLFMHCQQALSCSWSNLLQEGRAKVPDAHGVGAGSELKVEVMEEKLLRDLTREISSLLSIIASPGLNVGLPSFEPSGHAIRVDESSLKNLDTFASGSMVGFVLKHKALAVPVLQTCLEVFRWTDGEAVTKVSSFCFTVVSLAISTNNVELRQFVSNHLFSAIIQGLTLESNAVISADLVGLCREIFIYLCDRDPAPRQILLSLPHITACDLAAFEEALAKTSSPKEQKQHMKSLLLLATGNNLRALAAQKSVNVITNVSSNHLLLSATSNSCYCII
ncbi:hypothetical protein ACFE04_004927 [Oxalis oulophora]